MDRLDLKSMPLTSLEEAQALIAAARAFADARGISVEEPPVAPTTCCGRGCNGCVWEGFYAGLDLWRAQLLAGFLDR